MVVLEFDVYFFVAFGLVSEGVVKVAVQGYALVGLDTVVGNEN